VVWGIATQRLDNVMKLMLKRQSLAAQISVWIGRVWNVGANKARHVLRRQVLDLPISLKENAMRAMDAPKQKMKSLLREERKEKSEKERKNERTKTKAKNQKIQKKSQAWIA